MKKITLLLSGIILAVCLVGCTTETAGSSGSNGKDGRDGIGIVWQGSLDSEPSNPQLNWAYYNTMDRKSYIYDGSSWQILAESGEDGQNGENGNDGISILWKGNLPEAPYDPQVNWAYYNITDKKSYIFNGSEWQILTRDGEDGQNARLPSYTVKFSANGGIGEMEDLTVLCHVPILINNKCTKGGWTFTRWCINQNGTGKSYQNGEISTDLTGDGGTVTLYAIWKDNRNYIDASGDMVIGGRKISKTSLVPVLSEETIIPCDQNDGAFVSVRGSVILSPFSIGKYEVTQELFDAVMKTNPSYFRSSQAALGEGETDSLLRPVEQVSWFDAIAFCNKLSLLMGRTPCYDVEGVDDWGNLSYSSIPVSSNEEKWGKWVIPSCNWSADGYRLATECEWECAARGGKSNDSINWNYEYSGGTYTNETDQKDDVAWNNENSNEHTWEVGLKAPNSLGIYDMSGNVNELWWDFFNYGQINADTDVTGGIHHSGCPEIVYRGGSYGSSYNYLCVDNRSQQHKDDRYKETGFRIACTGK